MKSQVHKVAAVHNLKADTC